MFYLSPHRQVFLPHRQLLPRQFRVRNHRLTCTGGNRSPFIIISLYEHKASFLCYKSPASDGSPLKYKSRYTLAVQPQVRPALMTHLSSPEEHTSFLSKTTNLSLLYRR